ncbi:MAG TPA: PAS domain S-box protein, partial [Flavisolibacter sp.]|nr:PAS domain S-box protein [Flavisolibacter sp.]
MSTAPTFIFENEEGYKKLFDNAHDLIYFARPDGRLIYVNSSWMNVLGYGQEEIEGKYIYSFIDENDREPFYRYRDGLLAGILQQERITITLIAQNGRPVKAEGFILVQYADDEPIYTTGIFRDVTKNFENETRLQRSNEQLKQSESELQQLLIYAPDAIVVIDQDGYIIFWNPKAEQMFGWASDEVMGTDLTNTIVPPKHREGHNRGMKRYLQTGVPHVINRTVEITALKKSGEEFDVALTVSTTKQRGKIAFIAFIRDITDQKDNERELERSRKELQASNQQLEQFAHVASHDMKEPIRKIKTFSSLLTSEYEEALPENAKNYLEKIQRSAHRLSS